MLKIARRFYSEARDYGDLDYCVVGGVRGELVVDTWSACRTDPGCGAGVQGLQWKEGICDETIYLDRDFSLDVACEEPADREKLLVV